MQLLTNQQIVQKTDNITHEETQHFPLGLDLTVSEIRKVSGPGKLDFGGSEFAPAETEGLEPHKQGPDDDYGWWKLEPGSYLIRFNESLRVVDNEVALLQSHPRLILAGGSHPAMTLGEDCDPLEALLEVGAGGCHLKENCRTARIIVFNRPAS